MAKSKNKYFKEPITSKSLRMSSKASDRTFTFSNVFPLIAAFSSSMVVLILGNFNRPFYFFYPLLSSLDTSEIHSENDAFGSTSGGVLLKKV